MSKASSKIVGHLLAIITALFWSVTFIATDYLLNYYTSLQLLLIRFVVAYAVLWIVKPRFMKLGLAKQEIRYILMALFGVVGYYLLENYAIKATGATNTSILIALVPIVTLIMMCITGQKKKLTFLHFVGFIIAITGVCLVVYNGSAISLNFNYYGVAAALGCCLCWGIYSVLAAKNSKTNQIWVTRRMLFWTLIFVVPFALIKDGAPSLAPLLTLNSAVSVIVLGVFGSGLCYCMWNRSMHLIGVDITTNYIYIQPFITMLAAFVLGTEKITVLGVAGAIFIVLGVVLSDKAKK